MADNVAITEGTGTTIAADEIASVKYQRVKIAWGVDGAATDASASAPFPVVQTGTPALPSGAATSANQTTELSSLASILAKLSADPSTDTTLAAILAKIIAAPATSAKQDALAALIGEVQASPTSNTLLDRLKTIHSDLVGTLTVSGTLTAVTTVGTITNVVHVDDNSSTLSIDDGSGSLTVDNAGTFAVQADTELTTADLDTGAGTDTRAVIGLVYGASGGGTLVSTTNPLPIGDNGGSLTVDGSLTTVSTVSTITNVVHVDDNSSTISVDDGAGSLTVDGTVAATQSGTWTVQPGNTANTTAWKVDGSAVTQPVSSATFATAAKQPALGTAGSASADVITVQGIASGVSQPVTVQRGAAASATLIASTAYEASHVLKASAGTLISLVGYNSKTSAQFIQLYNSTTVPADTAVPVYTFTVPATSNFSLDIPGTGAPFTTGIAVANSSTGPTKTIGSADCYFSAVVI